MAIRHKRKNSAGYTWQAGDLVEGQIGLNIADGTLHFDKSDGSTVTISPNTNTTYAISAETNAAGADLRLTGSDATTDNVTIAAGTNITVARTDANTITINSTGVSETLRTLCYNADSVTLTKGMPVYVFGAQGQNISVKRASNVGDNESSQTLGLVEDDIAAGAEGFVVTFGEINNMNTNGYTEGAPFYLGATAGTITFTKPYAPAHLVYLGFVEKANASSGRVFVKPQNGYELEELHNVNINHNVASANKDYLVYNSSNSLWENRQLDIVNDTTPQLGGNLDVNGNSIVSVSNGNITLAPNGTGKVVISGDLQVDGTTTTINSTTLDVDDINITIAKGAANAAAANGGGITLEGPATAATITYASADDSWNLNKKTTATELQVDNININANTISSTDTNGNITLAPNGTGDVVLSADTVQVGDSNATATITTNGTGDLTLSTNSGTNSGTITITQGANANISITPNGTGDVVLSADTVQIGDSAATATLTTNGAGDLVLNTNAGTNSGSITIANGANANITIAPNGTGDVYLDADTLRVGDSGAAATITSNGTGNLVLNTNAGTNSGTITINQGTNGNIVLAPNGTGSVVGQGAGVIGIVSSTTTTSPISGRHTVTASTTDANVSLLAQKHRSDITLSSMTNEPAGIGFVVRDSASTNRAFGRLIARYQGTGTNPAFQMYSSVDGFTTTLTVAQFTDARTTLGHAATAQTLTTNGAANLTINTNAGTNSGSIVINQGANANISITPNGTGNLVLDGLNWPQSDGTNGQVLSTNGSGQLSWATAGGSSSQPISVLRATSRTTESGTTYRYNFTELGDSTGITSISAGDITIGTAGTYLFEFFANNFSTNPGTSWAIYNVTGAADLRSEDTFFGPTSSVYMIPPMMAVHTITTSNVYAIRQVDGNLHSDIYLKITKLA